MLSVRPDELERIGGAVCLDLVNTVDPRYGEDRAESLPDYEALLEWSVANGLLDRSAADRFAVIARRRPLQARAVHHRALDLREALFTLFRREPGPERVAALTTLNDELERSKNKQIKERDVATFESAWPETRALDQMLWPIASSAAELLTSARLARVRECEGDRCGWLFLDTSKAGRRRWCSMADCGNRAKAKRRRAARDVAGA